MNNVIGINPNESYSNFNDILNPLISKYFQIKYVRYNKYKHKNSEWITKGIMKSIAYRDKLYIKLNSTAQTSNQYFNLKTNYNTYNVILRKTIRAAKKQFYHNCFAKFRTDMKKTWSTINNIICKEKNKSNIPKYFLINGSKVTNDTDIANEFNNFFTNIGPKLASNIQTPTDKYFTDSLTNQIPHEFVFNPVTLEEVSQTINILKPKTSYSSDKMSNKLLKALSRELALPLKLIINQSFSMGILPDDLKIAKVTPLHKEKETYLLNNYRPISILPSVSKVFEKIMYKQIYDHFTNYNLFFKSQYGFRSGHSTEFALLEITDRIIKDMDKNKYPVNIYMDLSKAFDTLNHQILLSKLSHYGFRNKSLDLMKNYLNNRKQYVEYNSATSELLNITHGVPQGSILGPLLFNIYINDLPFITKHLEPIIYADDITLFATFSNLNFKLNEINAIQQELNSIHDWLKINKLSLNITKTKAMLFHTSKKQVKYPDLYLDNTKIDFVQNFNYLGIIIDNHLTFKSHINMVTNKISRSIGVMKRLKNTIPQSALLLIYNSLILSHMNYGLITWGSYIGSNCQLEKLQKRAIRLINNTKYNAHTSPLFRNDHILKFRDLCALHDYTFCYKFAHDTLPKYFTSNMGHAITHSYETRQRGQLKIPCVGHEYAKKSISYRYPSVHNTMPQNFKDKIYTHSLQGFKFNIKRTFLQSYELLCRIPNCYICQ